MSSAPSLIADGHCELADVLATESAGALRAEAAAFAPNAKRMPRDEFRVNPDQSVSSPRRLKGIAAGPVLRAIQRDEALLELIERIAGHRVAPTNGAYIYYGPGDYLGLHKDSVVCEVTLIAGVAGVLEALIVHPELVGLPSQELMEVSRSHRALPPGGTGVVVPPAGSFVMLLGSKVPHHRPPTRDHCAIATLCYA